MNGATPLLVHCGVLLGGGGGGVGLGMQVDTRRAWE